MKPWAQQLTCSRCTQCLLRVPLSGIAWLPSELVISWGQKPYASQRYLAQC